LSDLKKTSIWHTKGKAVKAMTRGRVDSLIREDIMFIGSFLEAVPSLKTARSSHIFQNRLDQRWTHLMQLVNKYYSAEEKSKLKGETNRETLQKLIGTIGRRPLPQKSDSLYYQLINPKTQRAWQIMPATNHYRF
jgi:hypothetical protein